MSETFSCGFVRSLLLKSSKEIHPSILQSEAYKRLSSNFNHTLTKGHFTTQFRKFMTRLKDKKWNQHNKDLYIGYFSIENWNNLSEEERTSHSIRSCSGCQNFHKSWHDKFILAKSSPLQDITNTMATSAKTPTMKSLSAKTPPTKTPPAKLPPTKMPSTTTPRQPSRKEKEEAMKLLNETSAVWEQTHSTPFTQVITQVKKSQLVRRMTSNEKLKKKRIVQREIKKHEESLWQDDDKDLDTLLATQQSFNSYKKQRKQLFHSSPSKTKSKTTNKRHAKRHTEIDFQKKEMLEYVKTLDPMKKFKLTKLAEMFGVPNKGGRGNIIVKEFLRDNGVQNESLNMKPKRQRRSKNKMQGSTGVSVATFRTAEKLKEALKLTLQNGKYSLGHLIQPKVYKKRVVGENGPVIQEFEVSGRKIPLLEIRRKLNRLHARKGVLRPGNVKRFFSMWSDHASIMNHGHLLLTYKPLFTAETFFSSKEMKEKFGVDMDVQEFVETPQLYILACSSDSVAEKMVYAECRVDDLLDLSTETTIADTTVKDVLRYFHADHPEISFEAGTSKGGTYPCICPVRKEKFVDLELCYNADIPSFEERRQKVIIGPSWKKGGASPYETLDKEGLNMEIALRNVDTWRKDGKNPTKEELKEHLKHEMKGIHRVPTLLDKNELTPLSDLNLGDYELSTSEPLHDTKGHIVNLWEAMKEVLSDSQYKLFKETLELAYGGKDKKRGCDYRASVILVYLYLCQNTTTPCSPEVTELLYTLMVLCQISYQPAEERSPKTVLLMYNVTFRHALIIFKLFGTKWSCSAVSNGKFYGLYFHSITAHFADIERTTPLSSMHSEEEERTFNAITSISSSTSSRTMEHVRDNCIIRLQAEQNLAMKEAKKDFKSNISKYGAEVKPKSRSRFCFTSIDKRLWQAHLERIADFLLVGEDKWWHREGDCAVFHDGDEDPEFLSEGPGLMEFTNYTLQSSKKEVQECWKSCISNQVSLPISSIVIYDSDGRFLCREELSNTFQPSEADESGIDPVDRAVVMEEVLPTPLPPVKRAKLPQFHHTITSQIFDIIGRHLLLNDLDKNLIDFEKNGYASALQKCKKMLPKLVSEVQKCRDESQEKLRCWSNDFFMENEREPLLGDIKGCAEAASMCETIRIADDCLRSAVRFGR